MNIRYSLLTIASIFLTFIPANSHAAQSLAKRLSGSILIQVEQHGEAWYVNPLNHQRYYLPDGDSAYNLMRSLGQGISDTNLIRIPEPETLDDLKNPRRSSCKAGSLGLRFRGQILLQVEQNGEAWYVSPDTCKRVYLRDGEGAYNMMRGLGKGITNQNLDQIPRFIDETEYTSSVPTGNPESDSRPTNNSTIDVLQDINFAKYEQGLYAEALSGYESILALDPKNVMALMMSSHIKNLTRDYLGSIRDANSGIEILPNFSPLYFYRGGSKFKLGDYRGAVSDLTMAIELDPNYTHAYRNRTLSYFMLDKDENGCIDLSKAGELGDQGAYELIREYCS